MPYDWFNRHRPYIKHRDQSVVLLMAAPAAIPALLDFIAFHKADLLLRTDTLPEEERRQAAADL